MSIKCFGIELGLNENEAKILARIGRFFKNIFTKLHELIKFRCPHCKSRKIIFKEYIGDEPLELYSCFVCGKKSIMTAGGLVEVEIK